MQGEDQPFIRNVMTLKSCSPIVGTDVMSFDTEREVLLAWRVFFLYLHTLFFFCMILNLLLNKHMNTNCNVTPKLI